MDVEAGGQAEVEDGVHAAKNEAKDLGFTSRAMKATRLAIADDGSCVPRPHEFVAVDRDVPKDRMQRANRQLLSGMNRNRGDTTIVVGHSDVAAFRPNNFGILGAPEIGPCVRRSLQEA